MCVCVCVSGGQRESKQALALSRRRPDEQLDEHLQLLSVQDSKACSVARCGYKAIRLDDDDDYGAAPTSFTMTRCARAVWQAVVEGAQQLRARVVVPAWLLQRSSSSSPSSPPAAAAALAAVVLLLCVVARALASRLCRARRCRRFYNGRHVWITGASSGIGAALARTLALRYGARVTLSARRSALLRALVHDIRSAGGSAQYVPLDASKPYIEWNSALQRVVELAGDVHIAVLNAGVNHNQRAFVELSPEKIDEVLQVNVRGTMFACSALLEHMLAASAEAKNEAEAGAGEGRAQGEQASSSRQRVCSSQPLSIAFVSSLSAYRGVPGGTVYAATKAALCCFVEGLRVEMRARSAERRQQQQQQRRRPPPLFLTTICPGFVHTPAIADLTHPKPFAVSAHTASVWMADAIARGLPHYGFPWIMEHIVMRVSALAPRALYERLMSSCAKASTSRAPTEQRKKK